MSSSRLPGKVLAPVLGQPMIGRQIERLQRSSRIDQLVVATSEDPSDDPLATTVETMGVPVVRGPLNDVLARFITVLDVFPQTQTVVRLTADCPLCDWRLIDAVIEALDASGADYVNNTLVRTYPAGLDAEAVRATALRRTGTEAVSAYDREHVTPYIYSVPGRFELSHIKRKSSLAEFRWTVDYPEDLDFVRHVYQSLYPANPDFSSDDILALDWNSSRYQAEPPATISQESGSPL